MKKIWAMSLAMLILTACGSQDQADEQSNQVAIEAPQMDKLIIYEVFVRNFTPEGTFQAIIPRLDELKTLGVNTLWLMPIHPVGEARRKGTYGSPYSIKDFYDVNPEFGSKEDFRALVNACHERGLYLIIDLVANHSSFDNAWITENPDWYVKNEAGEIVPPDPDWTDVADLNYDNPAVPAEMSKVMEYWVKEFDIDGYRCDVAYMVPHAFWKSSISNLRNIKPLIMLAEGAGTELHEAGFDYTYGWEIYHQLKKIYDGSSARTFAEIALNETAKVPFGNKIMRFTTNHDETSWDDVPVNLFKSREGSLAAFAASSMLPCVPMIYNGQEVGHPEKMNLFEKSQISWGANGFMRKAYIQMLNIYKNEPALRGDEVQFFDLGNDDIIAFQRGSGENALLILVNVRKEMANTALPEGWQQLSASDLMNGNTIKLRSNLNILGYSYYILKVAPLS
jgi:glycosidase